MRITFHVIPEDDIEIFAETLKILEIRSGLFRIAKLISFQLRKHKDKNPESMLYTLARGPKIHNIKTSSLKQKSRSYKLHNK